MSDLKNTLKDLISISGLSGYESTIRERIQKEWEPLVDELSISKIGSLHGLKRGTGTAPRRKILIATHMDAIGLMVTGIEKEFIHITPVGGVDPRILPGQTVIVHGKQELPGIIAQPAAHLLPPELSGKSVTIDYLFVDTGLRENEVKELVRVGDLVSFGQEPMDFSDEILVGHSLDNRTSVAALTACLEELKNIRHDWDVWAVATVQEEVTLAGAYTSSFDIRPDIAVAVDVTFAKGPGTSDPGAYALESGPSLGWGANIHPALFNSFKKICVEQDIPYTFDILPGNSGTDAVALQMTADGIPSMVISIPLRYMHTPVEMISMKDVKRTGRLLAQFIAQLSPDYWDHYSWDADKDE